MARLIRRIYEIAPLVCTDCGGEMRIVSFILDPAVVRKIVDHLGNSAGARRTIIHSSCSLSWDGREPRPADRPLTRPAAEDAFYALNFSPFVLPFLASYFAWKRSLTGILLDWPALPFVVAAGVINLLPFQEGEHTQALAALHFPIVL